MPGEAAVVARIGCSGTNRLQLCIENAGAVVNWILSEPVQSASAVLSREEEGRKEEEGGGRREEEKGKRRKEDGGKGRWYVWWNVAGGDWLEGKEARGRHFTSMRVSAMAGRGRPRIKSLDSLSFATSRSNLRLCRPLSIPRWMRSSENM